MRNKDPLLYLMFCIGKFVFGFGLGTLVADIPLLIIAIINGNAKQMLICFTIIFIAPFSILIGIGGARFCLDKYDEILSSEENERKEVDE